MNAEKHNAHILRDQADIYENVLSEHFIYILKPYMYWHFQTLSLAVAITLPLPLLLQVLLLGFFPNREQKWMVIQIYPSHFGLSNDPSCSSDRLMMKNYEEH